MAPVLTLHVNSWVTLAESMTYFDEKYGADAWRATLSDLQRTQLLISAYKMIKQQSEFSIADSDTSVTVKYAQLELAWFLYNYGKEYAEHQALGSMGVKSYDILDYSESLSDVKFPAFISTMLEGYSVDAGTFFPRIHRDLQNNSTE